ncbi:glycosyltransferase family 4 protein [Flaviflexus massiliensis]|uniref:glycosyltransferase family 4 protein n=1 Tax=Flaviflexus massiliensis TaxID=1522309 RepID=UPI00164D1CC5|nr:glycosyltransferase family 4 protein [Flaviflexus massiliensis]
MSNDEAGKNTKLWKQGRPAQIAQLVAHEVFNDSRVLKEATSVIDAGGKVQIIGRALPSTNMAERYLQVEGKSVIRIPGYSMYSILPEKALNKLRKASGMDANSIAILSQNSQPDGQSINAANETPEAKGKSSSRRTSSQRIFKLVKDGGYRVANLIDAPVGLASWWLRVVSELRKSKPDLIHCNDANTLIPGYLASKALKVPFVYDSHELWRHRATRENRIIAPHVEALIETFAAPRAAGIITVSQSIAEWLELEYKLPEMPTLVRNVPETMETEVPGSLREMAGLGTDDRIFSYSGSINPTRGIEIAVQALSMLPNKVHFVMLGYGSADYSKSLNDLAVSLGVEDRIHIVGPVRADEVAGTLSDSDVAYIYLKSDILSHRFALPNKLFEAIAGGLPVVVSNRPEAANLVSELGIGRILESDEPGVLASAVQAVLDDGAQYRHATSEARKGISWGNEAARMIDLYAKVLHGR